MYGKLGSRTSNSSHKSTMVYFCIKNVQILWHWRLNKLLILLARHQYTCSTTDATICPAFNFTLLCNTASIFTGIYKGTVELELSSLHLHHCNYDNMRRRYAHLLPTCGTFFFWQNHCDCADVPLFTNLKFT